MVMANNIMITGRTKEYFAIFFLSIFTIDFPFYREGKNNMPWKKRHSSRASFSVLESTQLLHSLKLSFPLCKLFFLS